MMKILVSTAAVLTVFCLVTSSSVKAQAVFESIYTQPMQMVDGFHVGEPLNGHPQYGSPTAVSQQQCQARAACGRRQFGH